MNQSRVKEFVRFTLDRRIEHILLLISFTTLCLTGLPQKFAPQGWAEGIIAALGGIETVRIIHRIAATVFILEIVYHLVFLGYKAFVSRVGMTMLPGIKDVRDGIQSVLFNLGLAKSRPKAGRYSFDEKLEYWAMVWGSVIMILTGLALWNPIATTSALPGQFVPAAKAAHGAEAILAFLGILVWHTYHVHLRSFNKSMFTGKLTRQEMEHEHPLELAAVEANQQTAKEKDIANRRRIFIPIAGILTLALLAGVYSILTFEKTAIDTVPPVETFQVFSPLTPTPIPTAPPQPTLAAQPGAGSLTWDGSIGAVFQQRCGGCHGSSGGFAAKTYADTMKGTTNGPVIIPGDADTSSLVVLQAGNHPGKFSQSELDRIKAWITAGAPES